MCSAISFKGFGNGVSFTSLKLRRTNQNYGDTLTYYHLQNYRKKYTLDILFDELKTTELLTTGSHSDEIQWL